jgi:hypothetical protein
VLSIALSTTSSVGHPWGLCRYHIPNALGVGVVAVAVVVAIAVVVAVVVAVAVSPRRCRGREEVFAEQRRRSTGYRLQASQPVCRPVDRTAGNSVISGTGRRKPATGIADLRAKTPRRSGFVQPQSQVFISARGGWCRSLRQHRHRHSRFPMCHIMRLPCCSPAPAKSGRRSRCERSCRSLRQHTRRRYRFPTHHEVRSSYHSPARSRSDRCWRCGGWCRWFRLRRLGDPAPPHAIKLIRRAASLRGPGLAAVGGVEDGAARSHDVEVPEAPPPHAYAGRRADPGRPHQGEESTGFQGTAHGPEVRFPANLSIGARIGQDARSSLRGDIGRLGARRHTRIQDALPSSCHFLVNRPSATTVLGVRVRDCGLRMRCRPSPAAQNDARPRVSRRADRALRIARFVADRLRAASRPPARSGSAGCRRSRRARSPPRASTPPSTRWVLASASPWRACVAQ